MTDLVKQFNVESADMEAWAKAKEEYLTAKDVIETLTSAQIQRTVLRGFEQEYATSLSRLDAFKNLAGQITGDNYKDSDAINAKVAELEATWSKLKDLTGAKDQALQAEFDRFDQKCKEFAEAASAFVDFLQQQRNELDALEGEPDPLGEAIGTFYENGKKLKERLDSVAALDQQLRAMQIAENPHTKLTLSTLNEKVREFGAYVKQYLDELHDESNAKKIYDEKAKTLTDWISETIPKLNDRSFDNTLPDAQAKVAAFTDFRNNEKAIQSANKSALEALSNTITNRVEASAHKRPPFTPELPVSAINEKWEAFLAADKEREAALNTELARQEKLDKLVKQFNNEAADIEAWAQKKEEYLTAKEVVETLTAAQVRELILLACLCLTPLVG